MLNINPKSTVEYASLLLYYGGNIYKLTFPIGISSSFNINPTEDQKKQWIQENGLTGILDKITPQKHLGIIQATDPLDFTQQIQTFLFLDNDDNGSGTETAPFDSGPKTRIPVLV